MARQSGYWNNWGRDSQHFDWNSFIQNAWNQGGGQEFQKDLPQLGSGNMPLIGLPLGDWLKSAFSQSTAPAPAPGSDPATQAQVAASNAQTDYLKALQASIGGTGAGTSAGTATAPAGYYTPDGVFISDNSPQDTYYRMIDAVWTRLYGAHPPFSMVDTMKNLGVENTSQLDTIMQGMPSHIKNPDGSSVSLGVYDQIKGSGNTLSDKYLGRPIPDSLIQDWVNKGITTPESIELWFLNHPSKDIPKDVYGQLFDAASGMVKQNFNDLPHPDTIVAANGVAQSLANPASIPGQPAYTP